MVGVLHDGRGGLCSLVLFDEGEFMFLVRAVLCRARVHVLAVLR